MAYVQRAGMLGLEKREVISIRTPQLHLAVRP